MMESNEYGHYEDSYNEYVGAGSPHDVDGGNDEDDDDGMGLLVPSSTNSIGGGGGTIANNNNNNVEADDPRVLNLPRILLMGPRRGGKTSIQKVVFHKMSPHETLFRLEATQSLDRAVVDHTPLCRFTVWDFPGEYYGDSTTGAEDDNDNVFAGATSLIFVVDAQDEPYDHVLQSLTNAVTRALEQNPNIVIEVFINKVDGELFLSDESKYDCRRDIMTQVTDELTDAGVSPDSIHIRYHLTSIYDHSIYEALSRVVQRLIPQLPTLENLLNVLVSTCSMEKAYLFDVVSKLYISTDPGPVDMQSVELCSDMIDVVLDVSGIYGLGPSQLELGNTGGETLTSITPMVQSTQRQSLHKEGVSTDELVGTLISQAPVEDLEEEMVDPDSAYDSESASVIRLSNGMVLYLKEVDTMLALVCITRAENFRKKTLINYNIGCLKKALRALVQPPPASAIMSRTDLTEEAMVPNGRHRGQQRQGRTPTLLLLACIWLLVDITSAFTMHSNRYVATSVGTPARPTGAASQAHSMVGSSHSSTRLFFGNNSTSDLSLSISEASHSSQEPTANNNGFKVYCDMDGVLVDFEKGVYNLLQTGTSNLDKSTMWKNIARFPHWFEQLEWKQDGRRLWQAIKHLEPDILTGVPDIQTSCVDKYNWCKRELQLQDVHHVDMAADGKSCAHESINGNQPREDATNVITCWSSNKYRECKRGSVLIDDRIDLKDSWEAAGGIFIHHVDTETTLHKLREHNILPEELEGEEWYWEGSWRLWRI